MCSSSRAIPTTLSPAPVPLNVGVEASGHPSRESHVRHGAGVQAVIVRIGCR